jgi:hypothetical protein
MPNSPVIEVALGLVFCFATIALIASSVYEAGASLFALRAQSLLEGVKDLLNDDEFSGLALSVYNSALVNPRDAGLTAKGTLPAVLPSYIEPRHFAVALLEGIQKAPGASADLKASIDQMPDVQLKRLLEGMYTRAEGKVDNVEAELARWFDASMARVSGAYKRKAQLFTFLLALAFAIALNVDTFRLFSALWTEPALFAQVSLPSGPGASGALSSLKQLPIGWDHLPNLQEGLLACLGFLVTATSALFGAPFWFGLLQRIVNLRGTGERPGDAKGKPQ